jgi:pyruvate/2-oxoglutarate dehydrogenase complex dihydrolipoamide acyltransferase (E2) component
MIYYLTVHAAVPGVEEIRILEWHGEPGHSFAAGDLIVELETHKAIVEVRASQNGVLRALSGSPGDWVRIEQTLALFSDVPEEDLPAEGEGAAELMVAFEVT